jgi:hypothetical protein
MLWMMWACAPPNTALHVDRRPEAALCAELPAAGAEELRDLRGLDEGQLVHEACHGRWAHLAALELVKVPRVEHLPLLLEHLHDDDVHAAVAAFDHPVAKRRARLDESERDASRRRRVRDGPQVLRLQIRLARGGPLMQAAATPGGRWLLWDELPNLSEEHHEWALEALIAADWSTQRAPDALVLAAKQRPDVPGAWRLLAQTGEYDDLRAALRGTSRLATKQALRAVTHDLYDPPGVVIDDAVSALGDPVDTKLLEAASAEGADILVLQQVLTQAGLPACTIVEALVRARTGLDNDLFVENYAACPTAKPPYDAPESVALRMLRWPASEGVRARLMDDAMRVAKNDVGVAESLLDSDDDVVGLRFALGFVERHECPDHLVDRIVVLSKHSDPGVAIAASQALARSHKDRALRVLVEQLENPGVRHKALELLVWLGTPEATETMLRLGSDPTQAWCHERIRRRLGIE